ncbi:hypothetical protein KIH39_02410 [Telmatocola sphagniphila]|uniref:Uncharacterized protein n=1 Tax=Telmatocola sphagniphila TaxID=1123043 RepID=A0A8E6ETS6_9BACT|nr:hypothetical protein [Telmatocola sphagniphila]QVL32794.1 hypothetical protein KIH39_02410 [Telmatocola sphagniphila]
MDSIATSDLLQQFNDKTLPKPLWTHEAHLRVGCWYVNQFGPIRALNELRQKIKTYNESVGGQNTDTSGYHETITRFYVMAIDWALKPCDGQKSLELITQEVLEKIGHKNYPLEYYSEAHLMSVAARTGWAEPDLKNFPWST